MNEERRCPNCGRVIPIDARVCPYCAKRFDESESDYRKKHSGFGNASLVLGIISMCLIWMTYIQIGRASCRERV